MCLHQCCPCNSAPRFRFKPFKQFFLILILIFVVYLCPADVDYADQVSLEKNLWHWPPVKGSWWFERDWAAEIQGILCVHCWRELNEFYVILSLCSPWDKCPCKGFHLIFGLRHEEFLTLPMVPKLLWGKVGMSCVCSLCFNPIRLAGSSHPAMP